MLYYTTPVRELTEAEKNVLQELEFTWGAQYTPDVYKAKFVLGANLREPKFTLVPFQHDTIYIMNQSDSTLAAFQRTIDDFDVFHMDIKIRCSNIDLESELFRQLFRWKWYIKSMTQVDLLRVTFGSINMTASNETKSITLWIDNCTTQNLDVRIEVFTRSNGAFRFSLPTDVYIQDTVTYRQAHGVGAYLDLKDPVSADELNDFQSYPIYGSIASCFHSKTLGYTIVPKTKEEWLG